MGRGRFIKEPVARFASYKIGDGTFTYKEYKYYPAYGSHKHGAKQRGIEFKLTFREWLDVWNSVGKIDQRGVGHGKFVMSRIGDEGVYELGNVFIQLSGSNSSDAHKNDTWKRCPIEAEKIRACIDAGMGLKATARALGVYTGQITGHYRKIRRALEREALEEGLVAEQKRWVEQYIREKGRRVSGSNELIEHGAAGLTRNNDPVLVD